MPKIGTHNSIVKEPAPLTDDERSERVLRSIDAHLFDVNRHINLLIWFCVIGAAISLLRGLYMVLHG